MLAAAAAAACKDQCPRYSRQHGVPSTGRGQTLSSSKWPQPQWWLCAVGLGVFFWFVKLATTVSERAIIYIARVILECREGAVAFARECKRTIVYSPALAPGMSSALCTAVARGGMWGGRDYWCTTATKANLEREAARARIRNLQTRSSFSSTGCAHKDEQGGSCHRWSQHLCAGILLPKKKEE